MPTRAEIMKVRSLADKKGRAEHGLFVVEGRKMVGEAIASGLVTEEIYATEEHFEAGCMTLVSGKEMERLSHLKTPPGILALVRIPESGKSSADASGLSLALDGVRDPGNMGTILRLVDWFGVGTVFCSPDCADIYNPKVVQASMGSIFRVEVIYGDLPALLTPHFLPESIFGTFLDGEDIYDAALPQSGVIVMGNEGKGISAGVAPHIGRKLFIPPYPVGHTGAESLNVASATAVILSEFRRRR